MGKVIPMPECHRPPKPGAAITPGPIEALRLKATMDVLKDRLDLMEGAARPPRTARDHMVRIAAMSLLQIETHDIEASGEAIS